jgi:hypothetical protein
MVLSRESKYPNRRAYVVKLRADARPEAFAGRIENLVTGRLREFACVDELVAFVIDDLRAAGEDGANDARD